jgi:hypothetical protein
MTQAEFDVFAVELAKTADLFGEALHESRGLLYFEALADLPLPTVVAGLFRARQECRFFPKPGEVRELVAGSRGDQAEVAWARFLAAVRQHGSYASVDFGDAALHETVRVLWGGWDQTWRLETSELPYKHAEFLKIYRAMAKRGLPPAGPMLGQVALDNAARGFFEWIPQPISVIDTPALPPVKRLAMEERTR